MLYRLWFSVLRIPSNKRFCSSGTIYLYLRCILSSDCGVFFAWWYQQLDKDHHVLYKDIYGPSCPCHFIPEIVPPCMFQFSRLHLRFGASSDHTPPQGLAVHCCRCVSNHFDTYVLISPSVFLAAVLSQVARFGTQFGSTQLPAGRCAQKTFDHVN